jgi:transcriptional regulator with XRE-family HTH domain
VQVSDDDHAGDGPADPGDPSDPADPGDPGDTGDPGDPGDSGDPWAAQQEALGAFLRSQRRLARLSLRDMAERTKVSNAYLSQLERGLHAPSVRVLRSIGKALDLSAEAMLAQAGLMEDEPDRGAGEPRPDKPAGPRQPSTEAAIRADPNLSDDQKDALLSVYRSYLASNRGA